MPASAITNTNLTRSALPAVTLTDAISVADLSNQYRPRFFLDSMSQISWLYEYDSPMMRLLDVTGSGGIVATQPKIEWTEASRLQTASRLATALDASTTTVVLEDAGIANVGQFIYAPGGEWMEVTARTLGTNTLTVVRGALGTRATTHAQYASFVASAQFMGEKDIPREGTGTMPGKSQYNFATIYAKTYSATRLNDNTIIEGEWGQLEKERILNMYALRVEVGQALYFSPRYVDNVGSKGPRYVSGGLTQFIKSNVLNLDKEPARHSYEVLNAFYENLFRPDASSGSKISFDGRDAFFAYKRIAREQNRLDASSEDAVKLGEQDFVFQSEYGPVRHVLADMDLPSNRNYGLGDWSFVVDPANLRSGTLTDFGSMQLVPDIETPRQRIMVKEDAVVGSIWIAPQHEQTHGIIRGAPKSLTVQRAELL